MQEQEPRLSGKSCQGIVFGRIQGDHMTQYSPAPRAALPHGKKRKGLACASVFLLAPSVVGQTTIPTPPCTDFSSTPWIQVNGAFTDQAQYVDAGEPMNIPASIGFGGQISFSSVVTNNGDLLYIVPSAFGARLGRLSAAKQWQIWTDSGWSNSSTLAPRSIENTVLFYKTPKLFAHPTAPGGVIGVSNALVHSGGNGFDFHNFRVNFEFDGSEFRQWTGDFSFGSNGPYDPLYAKQLIPGRLYDLVDFAYDPATQTGIVVGGFGTNGSYDKTKLSAVRYDFNASQKWHRWERSDASDFGHWHTDNEGWTARHVNVLDWNSPQATLSQSEALITRVPSTTPQQYLVTFRQTGPSQNILTAARYTDATIPLWEWWRAGVWRNGPVTPGVPFDFSEINHGASQNEPFQQVGWYSGKIAILSLHDDGNLYEIIYDNATSTFHTPTLIVSGPFLHPTHFLGNSSFVVGVDHDNTLWLAYTRDGTTIKILSRSVGQKWEQVTSVAAPMTSVPVGINFIDGQCLPVVFVEHTVQYPDSRPDEVRLYAISPSVSYWSGEGILSVSPPPVGVILDEQHLGFMNSVTCGTAFTTNSFTFPGNVGVDADGYVYAPSMSWSATTIIPPLVGGVPAPMNYTWGTGNFDASIFAQGAAVDRVRSKVYIANRAVGGSDEDMLPSPYHGTISVWDVSLRTTNCGWASPPAGFNTTYRPSEPIVGLGWASDVAVDQNHGLLYVADGMECRVHVYTLAGIVSTTPSYLYSFGSRGTGNSQFMFVKGIDVDANGNLFAVDCGNNRVHKWFYNATTARVDGSIPYTWGMAGRGAGQFINPVGLDVDEGAGRVYVSDPVNHRVQAFNTNGVFQFQFSYYWDRAVVPNVLQPLGNSVGIGSNDAGILFLGVDGNLASFGSD